ncbi:MAG TPA: hypothetical protein DEB17_01080 [Chlorobaculum sp.]|uniref:Uncharacterized protein n=1 Tax=Chlorobaculum tepidum (strain ATCC 49652 / DSM 12025 / NBRC 103806 / TLS) TaxID=194439 RepID=Q8KCA6_CHLTE|nr:hypothetical protein CT1518 [Chlorobaculum tepidum TLS]HBU22592.1 hypothetical protein [Chlorobaculum sp.]
MLSRRSFFDVNIRKKPSTHFWLDKIHKRGKKSGVK